MTAETEAGVSLFDWFFRGLASAASIITLLCGYILSIYGKKIEAIDTHLTFSDEEIQRAHSAIQKQELSMAQLQIRITDTVSKSIERVHDKIEDASETTDKKIDSLLSRIERLGTELMAEIRKST
jgi:prefoldin subunit 5